MKKYILTGALLATLLVPTACDDNKEQYLSDYNTILYLRNSGEQPFTVWKTGENTDYTVTVNKAGWNLDATAQVKLKVMDDASLNVYNMEQGTDYKAFTKENYDFTDATLDFVSSDLYKANTLTIKTDNVEDFIKANSENNTCVIPFEIYDGTDSINVLRQQLFVKPEVEIPYIGFATSGYTSKSLSDTEGAPTTAEFKYTVELPINNKWDIPYTVDIVPKLLDEYNKENEVAYTMLPKEAYSLVARNFTKDSVSTKLTVTVDRTKLTYGNYVLPMQLSGRDGEKYFPISPTMSTNLAGVSYVPDTTKLSLATLDPDKATYYPENLNEGSVADLFDDNPGSIYHSQYSPKVAMPHWLTFELPHEATAIRFKYLTRNNTAGAPWTISLYGSMDGVTFTKFTMLTKEADGLPIEASTWFSSNVLVGPPMKYLRFQVDKAGTSGTADYFNLAEFRLYTD
ncbi:MAG: DUF1735 domain-containing protein [Mediterranea sp.]|jgi:hypothetical protein|nr:DUF1735 domain-containing protein [Mediterranea sp.]